LPASRGGATSAHPKAPTPEALFARLPAMSPDLITFVATELCLCSLLGVLLVRFG
jgi:hypothetical protein